MNATPEHKRATYKTATAAAHAAEAARDEARECAEIAQACATSAQNERRSSCQACGVAILICSGLLVVNALVCVFVHWVFG